MFDLPTPERWEAESGLSYRWPVTYWDGLPPTTWRSPIQVLTRQDTAGSWTCNPLITSPTPFRHYTIESLWHDMPRCGCPGYESPWETEFLNTRRCRIFSCTPFKFSSVRVDEFQCHVGYAPRLSYCRQWPSAAVRQKRVHIRMWHLHRFGGAGLCEALEDDVRPCHKLTITVGLQMLVLNPAIEHVQKGCVAVLHFPPPANWPELDRHFPHPAFSSQCTFGPSFTGPANSVPLQGMLQFNGRNIINDHIKVKKAQWDMGQ